MGFFDKAKTFLGGHGAKVHVTRLERQDPQTVTFPVTDTVFKGNYDVRSDKECVVLAHVHELFLEKKHADGREERVLLGASRHDETTEIIGCDLRWPYTLGAGQQIEDSFLIPDVDIPGVLARLGYPDPGSALDRPELRFFIRVTADVKGSPFDATADVPVSVVY